MDSSIAFQSIWGCFAARLSPFGESLTVKPFGVVKLSICGESTRTPARLTFYAIMTQINLFVGHARYFLFNTQKTGQSKQSTATNTYVVLIAKSSSIRVG